MIEIKRFNKQTGKHEIKVYETVAERLRKFREACPIEKGWGLNTEIQFPDPETVLAIARITNPSGQIVATGTAEEKRNGNIINKTSAVENAETSAIGRCLMAAGFGGGEFCSAEELFAALQKQQELEKALRNPSQAMQQQKQSQQQSQQQNSLPQIEGVKYIKENNRIVAQGKTWGKQQFLKSAGFTWNPTDKVWEKAVA